MTNQTNVDFEIPVKERLQAAIIDLLKQFFAFIKTSRPYFDALSEWRKLPTDQFYRRRSYHHGFDYTVEADVQVGDLVKALVARFQAEATMRAQHPTARKSGDTLSCARSELQKLMDDVARLDQDAPTRALLRQAEAVLRRTHPPDSLDLPEYEFSRYVQQGDALLPEPTASVAKFAERFVVLKKAMFQAARAHIRARNTRNEASNIWRAIEKHYGEEIEFPSKPTAEEIYLLISRWTEWTKQLFALEREARLVVIGFKNAVLPRKLALRELENAMQNVPSVEALTDFTQIALVVVSE